MASEVTDELTVDDPGFRAFSRAVQDLFVSMRQARARLAGEGEPTLSLSQLHLLDALEDESPLSVGELAARAAVSSPTATRMLKTLERDGVVRRQRAADSERRVEVSLTRVGRIAVREQRRRVRERQLVTFSRLDPGERREMVDSIRRLVVLLEDLT